MSKNDFTNTVLNVSLELFRKQKHYENKFYAPRGITVSDGTIGELVCVPPLYGSTITTVALISNLELLGTWKA